MKKSISVMLTAVLLASLCITTASASKKKAGSNILVVNVLESQLDMTVEKLKDLIQIFFDLNNSSSDADTDPDYPSELLQTDKPYPKKKFQGIAITGDKLFRLFNGGYAAIYDLSSANGEYQKCIDHFSLGAESEQNHAGVASFADEVPEGYDFPLLYVSGGTAKTPATCYVEKITEDEGSYSSTLVQTITLDQTEFEAAGLISFFPWGKWCTYGNYLYLVSSLTRANGSTDQQNNACIVTKFRRPEVNADITLSAADVLEQFTLPFVDDFGQGITIYNDRLIQVFGCPSEGYYSKISVSSLSTHSLITVLDMAGTELEAIELEDCAIYNNKLILGTTRPSIYQIELFS